MKGLDMGLDLPDSVRIRDLVNCCRYACITLWWITGIEMVFEFPNGVTISSLRAWQRLHKKVE